MGQIGEAVDEASRALAIAQQLAYPVGKLLALAALSLAALYVGDYDDAVRLARLAAQITAGIPGSLARRCSHYLTVALIEAGDLADAERVSAAGLARAGEAGDLWNQGALLPRMVDLDLRARRIKDAAAHLQEALQIAVRTGNRIDLLGGLYQCGNLCAATGRQAEALTVWAANDTLAVREGFTDPPWHVRRWEEQVGEARQALEPGEARAAEERGAAMSHATAAEFALVSTAAEPQQAVAGPGLGQRSARERELVTLVAQGYTNAQIAAQALHQHPHGQLTPGPHPRQDRLPPTHQPDPPGPGRGPGLAPCSGARRSQISRSPTVRHRPAAPRGHSSPRRPHHERGRPTPAPRVPGRVSLSGEGRNSGPALIGRTGPCSRIPTSLPSSPASISVRCWHRPASTGTNTRTR